MREKPILFSGPMVRAILEGSKTQTRRVCKLDVRGGMPQPEFDSLLRYCPYGQPGDRLWVRETCWLYGRWEVKGVRKNGKPSWRFVLIGKRVRFDKPGTDESMAYWGGGEGWSWRPSIHMPRWASRITLEITGVRVERLGEISESDARAEGVQSVAEFKELWASINGPGSWEANPWVWVVEFRRI